MVNASFCCAAPRPSTAKPRRTTRRSLRTARPARGATTGGGAAAEHRARSTACLDARGEVAPISSSAAAGEERRAGAGLADAASAQPRRAPALPPGAGDRADRVRRWARCSSTATSTRSAIPSRAGSRRPWSAPRRYGRRSSPPWRTPRTRASKLQQLPDAGRPPSRPSAQRRSTWRWSSPRTGRPRSRCCCRARPVRASPGCCRRRCRKPPPGPAPC